MSKLLDILAYLILTIAGLGVGGFALLLLWEGGILSVVILGFVLVAAALVWAFNRVLS